MFFFLHFSQQKSKSEVDEVGRSVAKRCPIIRRCSTTTLSSDHGFRGQRTQIETNNQRGQSQVDEYSYLLWYEVNWLPYPTTTPAASESLYWA
eukprot:scaffold8553_cov111-Amphora_coffeaeformis.AAC.4